MSNVMSMSNGDDKVGANPPTLKAAPSFMSSAFASIAQCDWALPAGTVCDGAIALDEDPLLLALRLTSAASDAWDAWDAWDCPPSGLKTAMSTRRPLDGVKIPFRPLPCSDEKLYTADQIKRMKRDICKPVIRLTPFLSSANPSDHTMINGIPNQVATESSRRMTWEHPGVGLLMGKRGRCVRFTDPLVCNAPPGKVKRVAGRFMLSP